MKNRGRVNWERHHGERVCENRHPVGGCGAGSVFALHTTNLSDPQHHMWSPEYCNE